MPELAVVYGPWLFQTEYAASFLNGAATLAGAPINGGQMFTQAYYAEVLYFLTGEHREYERKQAAFGGWCRTKTSTAFAPWVAVAV